MIAIKHSFNAITYDVFLRSQLVVLLSLQAAFWRCHFLVVAALIFVIWVEGAGWRMREEAELYKNLSVVMDDMLIYLVVLTTSRFGYLLQFTMTLYRWRIYLVWFTLFIVRAVIWVFPIWYLIFVFCWLPDADVCCSPVFDWFDPIVFQHLLGLWNVESLKSWDKILQKY